jgi:RimJ/RimL family protein N-acetyltransferase
VSAGTERPGSRRTVDRVVVRLHNGDEVTIRPIRPDDKPLLAAGLAGLSDESAYRRFLAPKKRLTPGELRYLTELDFRDHVAFVAVPADDAQRLVGVARWVRSADDPQTAELAFLVSDRMQGQGLGSALGQELAESARALGVERFVATTLPHNVAAHRLVARLATGVTTRVEGGMHELRGELEPGGHARTTSNTPGASTRTRSGQYAA